MTVDLECIPCVYLDKIESRASFITSVGTSSTVNK